MINYQQLVADQRNFFKTGATKSYEARRQALLSLRKMITENEQEMLDVVYEDLKRLPETSKIFEVGMVIVEIDYFLANLKEWMKPEDVARTFASVMDKPFMVKDPLGVALIVAPWNYPLSMVLLPLVAALGAGNTVIIKPSELAENTSNMFAKIVPKYFDQKQVAVCPGGVTETTEILKQRFDFIFYTGCPPVAKIIMAAASKHLTPVALELGGKCPVIVEKDADIDISAKRIVWGKWLNVGQTCLAPDYLIVTPAVKDKLLASIQKYIVEFYGNDAKLSRDYSRIINQRHFDRISALLDRTKGTILYKGGERDRDDLFIPPTILDCQPDDVFMEDEIFGPVFPVLTVQSFDEALDLINRSEKPLAAYIFTRSDAKIKRLYTETSSGAITVNDTLMHLTVDTLPFGGVGNSGMGRYRGKFGFDTFTHHKAVLQRGFFGESLIASRYPPMTPQKLAMMQRLTGKRIGFSFFGALSLPVMIVSMIMGMLLQLASKHSPRTPAISRSKSENEKGGNKRKREAENPDLKRQAAIQLENDEEENSLDYWKMLAKAFNCDDACSSDEADMMDELLHLCSWFEQSYGIDAEQDEQSGTHQGEGETHATPNEESRKEVDQKGTSESFSREGSSQLLAGAFCGVFATELDNAHFSAYASVSVSQTSKIQDEKKSHSKDKDKGDFWGAVEF
ncbi:hypothetical protein WR25_20511 [Diploscapter pachys]|uniref:Aldehyde dehydrogenase domain-containing protein n=1 Tax=Diploscapter pachys TaxID=2018661 RepID=A0A2A2LS71_9BILA|nr:hypothetical protein WR25_20511 [Diploscapter pachys]